MTKTVKYEPKPGGKVTLDKNSKPTYQAGGSKGKSKGNR